MLYAVKFDFDTDVSIRSGTKILVYPQMIDAAAMFNTLSLAYALAKPVAVKGGSINVLGTWLYEVDASDEVGAIEEVKAGAAVLVDFAPELAIDLESFSN